VLRVAAAELCTCQGLWVSGAQELGIERAKRGRGETRQKKKIKANAKRDRNQIKDIMRK
jgi:hypothetical protein